ncbi:hypothetical protein ACWD4V_18260 [Streptomyces tsukubensis]
MTSVDDLLARARVQHRPCDQADIDAAAVRIATRAAAAASTSCQLASRWGALLSQPAPDAGYASAAGDLTVLCQAVITHPAALTDLKRFFARVPGPAGARVLGCMLSLVGKEDSPRSLWQYAAGAGDPAAAYCLALHHRSLGETSEADWWQSQGDATLPPAADDVEEIELATALRILRALRTGISGDVPVSVTAVLHYVPGAVAFVDDDLDLPLPDADFADRIHELVTAAAGPGLATGGRRPVPLPERRADAHRPRITAAP